MTHDPLCPSLLPYNTLEGYPCQCRLIAQVRQDERRQAQERAQDPIYETTGGLSAERIEWAINPDAEPHRVGWWNREDGTVEVCQRCGEPWPCAASGEKS